MKDPWNVWTRAWFLIGQHAEVELHAKFTVDCKICSQTYNSYEYSTDRRDSIQGHDICAWIKKLSDGRWVIHCGYGSEFDLMEFWYLKDFPVQEIDGICDWCIRRMLRDGVIMDSGKEPIIRG